MEYNDLYKAVGMTDEEITTYQNDSLYSGYPKEVGGSVWENEGKSIYTLIRHFKPQEVLEIGNFRGVSSNHILQAIADNKAGNVTLVDLYEWLDYDKLHNQNFTRVLQDSLEYLKLPFNADFLVVDGCHEYAHVKKELELILAYNKGLNSGPRTYYIWAHDYFVTKRSDVGVKEAWDEIIAGNPNVFEFIHKVKGNESDCGFIFAKVRH